MTPQQRRRRPRISGGVALFGGIGVATGIAFGAGSYLRTSLPTRAYAAAERPTRLAQADPADPLVRITREPGQRGARRGKSGDADDDVGIAPLSTFETVFDLVKQNYVDTLPDDRKMTHGALKAMLSEVAANNNDPNTRFLAPDERAAMEAEAQGRFAGIGAALAIVPSKREGYSEFKITVVAPMPGSPAEKAGLKSGDRITAVDGKWVLTAEPVLAYNRVRERVKTRDASEDDLRKAFEAAQERVRSAIDWSKAQRLLTMGTGEKRTLTVQRAGVAQPLTISLTTAATQVEPVTTRTLAGGVPYVRIALLTEKSGTAFKQALANAPKRPGLVLDLRGNPGGLLDPAKEIAAQLTRGGKLFASVGPGGKTHSQSTPAVASKETRPVVVLIDGGTASVAEALAVSLRDRGVGTLIGQKSFGDAMEQTLYPLPDGSAYTLTTGKMQSTTGTSWQTAGLKPNVALPSGTIEDQVLVKAVAVLKDRAGRLASSGTPRS